MHQPTEYTVYPSLRDRIVLVTGGASGIGEGIVRAFCANDARVIFLDREVETGKALAAELAHTPGATLAPIFRGCDLADIAALQATVEDILAQQGTVDILVNNAGNDTRHSIESVTPESWDRTMAINLKQQFFMTQAVLPAMRRARRGSIINLSSIAWVIPSVGVPVYVSAKAGVVGMTRTLAHEVGADNIRVNAILPGAIVTPRQERLWLTPEYKAEILARQALKHFLAPPDVARLALFLASDDSASITGQSHIVDGGFV